ncbi:MAG: DUF3592 domain-containing protein [Clostridia bacterium]|nr:DUF3592 domain-containing protein [Clostridia bacterium]
MKWFSWMLVVVLCCIPLLAFVGLTGLYVRDVDEYERLEHTAVAVTARVSRVEKHSDSEGSDSYRIFITYEHKGRTYADVRYKTLASNRMPVGTTVKVWIDPEEPGHLRPERPGIIWAVLLWVFFGAVMTGLIWLLCFAWSRSVTQKRRPELYATGVISSDLVREELLQERATARRQRLWLSVGLVLACAAGAAAYMAVAGTTTAFSAAMPMAIIVLLVNLLFFRVGDVQVKLQETVFEGIVTGTDFDGDKTMHLSFTGLRNQHMGMTLVTQQDRTWHDGVRRGDTLYAAIVNGKPQRFYHCSEFRVDRI